jgi:hypothetical protein
MAFCPSSPSGRAKQSKDDASTRPAFVKETNEAFEILEKG